MNRENNLYTYTYSIQFSTVGSLEFHKFMNSLLVAKNETNHFLHSKNKE